MSRTCPCWLYRDGDKWRVKDGAKKTLNYIFKRTCEGIGQLRLLAELQERFKPLGKSKRWNASLLSKILVNRAVLGEMTPLARTTKPKPPIVGYYPRLVEDGLWYQARAAIEARKKAPGRNGEFVNLFTGLVKFPDGYPGRIKATTWQRQGATGTPLPHFGGLQGQDCGACKLSADYDKVERYALAMLRQVEPSDLSPRKAETDDIKAKERELLGMELRSQEVEKELMEGNQPVKQLREAAEGLNERIAALQGQIERMRRQEATATAKPLEAAQGLLDLLADKPPAERHDLRLKLRGLIADLVERIEIEPYKQGHGTEARITAWWKDRASRAVAVDTGHMSEEDTALLYGDTLATLDQYDRMTEAELRRIMPLMNAKKFKAELAKKQAWAWELDGDGKIMTLNPVGGKSSVKVVAFYTYEAPQGKPKGKRKAS